MTKKKTLAIFLSSVIALSSITPVFAAPTPKETPIEDKVFSITGISKDCVYNGDPETEISIADEYFSKDNAKTTITIKDNTKSTSEEEVKVFEVTNGTEKKYKVPATAFKDEDSYSFTAKFNYDESSVPQTVTKTFNFTVDKTAPAVVVSGITEGFLGDTFPTITASSSATDLEEYILTLTKPNGSKEELKSTDGTFNINSVASADGKYKIEINAVDKAGNKSVTSTFNVTKDSSTPVATINGFSDGDIVKTAPNVTVSSASSVNVYNILVKKGDEVIKEVSTSSLNLKGIVTEDGTYSVYAYVVGTNGHTSETVTKAFTLDTVAPDASISGITDNGYSNKDVTIAASTSDPNVDPLDIYLTVSKDGTDQPNINASSATFSEDGKYVVTAVITDKAGNVSKKVLTFTIDKTLPTVEIKRVSDGKILSSDDFVKSTSDLSITNKDKNPDSMHIIVTKNGQKVDDEITTDVSKVISNYSGDGGYSFSVTATDKAGNTSVKNISVTKDSVSPILSITGAENGGFYNKDVHLVTTVTDLNRDKESMSITRDENSVGTTALEQTVSDEGSYHIVSEAIDKAGNKTKATLDFTIDKTPPVTTISGLSNTHYRKPGAITATSSEVGNVFMQIKRDGSSQGSKSGQNSVSYSAFNKDGNYTVTAYSVDRAGNKSKTATQSFVKDSTAPVVSISGANNGSMSRTAKSIVFKVSERYYKTNRVIINVTKTVRGKSSSVPYSFSNTGTVSTGGFKASQTGTYNVRIYAIDKAGNKSQVKGLVFSVDSVKPVVKINAKDAYVYKDKITPSATFDDDFLATKVVRLRNTSSKKTLTLPSSSSKNAITYRDFPKKKQYDGIYLMTAVGRDRAGNTTTVTKKFIVNRFGSVFTLVKSPKGYNKKAEEDVVIKETNVSPIKTSKVTLTRDGKVEEAKEVKTVKAKNSNTYTIPASNFKKNGIYEVNIKTKDSAGNVSESAKNKKCKVWFAVDNKKPIVKVTGVKNGELVKKDSVKVYVSAMDTISSVKVSVKVDGSKVTLNKDNEGSYFTLHSGYNQSIKVTAKDKAGNKGVKELSGISVSTSPFAKLLAHKGLLLVIFLLPLAIVLIILKKRHSDDDEEDDDDFYENIEKDNLNEEE